MPPCTSNQASICIHTVTKVGGAAKPAHNEIVATLSEAREGRDQVVRKWMIQLDITTGR